MSGRVADEWPGLEWLGKGLQALPVSAPYPKVWLIAMSHGRGHEDVVWCLGLDLTFIRSQYMWLYFPLWGVGRDTQSWCPLPVHAFIPAVPQV